MILMNPSADRMLDSLFMDKTGKMKPTRGQNIDRVRSDRTRL